MKTNESDYYNLSAWTPIKCMYLIPIISRNWNYSFLPMEAVDPQALQSTHIVLAALLNLMQLKKVS